MKRGKVLVVDDEESIRTSLRFILDDFDITSVPTGEEALSLLERPNVFDVALVDVKLPGIKGIDLLTRIKEINSRVKVVIITGFDSRDMILESLRRHADDYVEKPFEADRLKASVSRLIEEKKPDFPEGKIGSALRMLKENYKGAVSLNDIARSLFLHPKYLSRAFKEKTGKSFNQYKIELRMSEARKMLRKTRMSVSQIAYSLGYENSESFMKIFKRLENCTPSEYRDKSVLSPKTAEIHS